MIINQKNMKTKQSKTKILLIGVMLTILSSFNACKEDSLALNATITKPSLNFVGLTNSTTAIPGQLIRYNSANTNQLTGAAVTITGLTAGESTVAIDYRPATGQLYGLGNAGRLYILNPVTGAAKLVGGGTFVPTNIAGFDFDPVTDRIRVVTSSNLNVTINPEDGSAVLNTPFAVTTPATVLGGAAYSNNVAGASSTVLYDLDIINRKLYKQDPDAGTLTEVGLTGLSAAGATVNSGFDISPSGIALAAFTSAVNQTLFHTLFQIDLKTGRATDLGLLPLPAPSGAAAASSIIGIAINTNPVAYAVDDANNLLIFNPTKSAEPVIMPITGLGIDKILSIDFRQSNGKLYGLGTTHIYTINTVNANATVVPGNAFTTTLVSTDLFGFDFDPVGGLIRVVNNNNGQNITIDPANGNVDTKAPLAITTGNVTTYPTISGISYNNTTTLASSILYGIDYATDKLVKINPATGVVTNVGSLGINIEDKLGFDIGTASNKAYGIFKVGTAYKVYTVNLLSGTTTFVADFPKAVRSMTLGLGF